MLHSYEYNGWMWMLLAGVARFVEGERLRIIIIIIIGL